MRNSPTVQRALVRYSVAVEGHDTGAGACVTVHDTSDRSSNDMSRSAILNAFAATNGRVRALVCALLYSALAFWLFTSGWLLGPVLRPLASALHLGRLDAPTIAFYEAVNLGTALLLTAIFAWYEHRRIDSYGLPLRGAFGALFFEGCALGVVNAGAVALGMIALGGMRVCYSVLRTGTLWMAVGYHVAFDYMQLFVIGTRNGNVEPEGHLLRASFQGPAWVTGGVLGTEASFLMYPLIALMFLYVRWRFRHPAAGALSGNWSG